MKKIIFYFDFLSPFSYFAWLNHRKALSEHNLTYEYKPVLMGKLFTHHGFPGPGEIKSKRAYELKKCFRYAFKNDITFSPPPQFPFNPLAIIRMATNHAAADQQVEIIGHIFDLVWGHGSVLEDPDIISALLIKRGISEELMERSFEREAKLELKANIKEALSQDIFGVPSFSIGNEYFWGNDSFEDLSNFLNGHDNWDKELYNKLLN